jgi:glucose-6-phosphate isomerase
MIRLDDDNARPFLNDDALRELRPSTLDAHRAVLDKTGAGSDLLGWRDLLLEPNDALLEDIETTAAQLRRNADVLLCLGIGGSYLGARAVLEALTPYFSDEETRVAPPDDHPHSEDFQQHDLETEVLFAGHQMSGPYLRQLLDSLEGRSVYVNVISKSGTTLETALAFRFVRRWMEEHFEAADDRIIVTTDPSEGALNELRAEKGYKKYAIPRDVGGRFSVLTPVGLFPIAAAGIDVRSLFYGARSEAERLDADADAHSPALRYAALRHALLKAGYDVEVLASFAPRLGRFGAWWQQLFGESEGKEGTGLYPSTVQYSTDLHSLGQYMQEGQRLVTETFLIADEPPKDDLTVPEDAANLDGLNYLAGCSYHHVNRRAYEGTAKAHTEGGVPNVTIRMDRIGPEALGEAIYFFEHAVAVSGYLLGVNPFDQPGVEAYKTAMFDLLGRP